MQVIWQVIFYVKNVESILHILLKEGIYQP